MSTSACVGISGQRLLLKSLVCSLCEVYNIICLEMTINSLFVSQAVPATFKVSLKSQDAEEGNSVSLRCELSKKGVQVQWKRDAQQLSEEMFPGKYQMKVEGKTAQLTIHSVRPEDAGRYSCVAGDEKTTAEVRVKGKLVAGKTPVLLKNRCIHTEFLMPPLQQFL